MMYATIEKQKGNKLVTIQNNNHKNKGIKEQQQKCITKFTPTIGNTLPKAEHAIMNVMIINEQHNGMSRLKIALKKVMRYLEDRN